MKQIKYLDQLDRVIVTLALFCGITFSLWLICDIAFNSRAFESQSAIGKIYEVKNRVRRKLHRSIRWYDIWAGEIIYEKDWVFTGSDSLAKIKFSEGGEVIVESNSLVILKRENGPLEINLQYGSLMADINQKNNLQINVVNEDGGVEALPFKRGAVHVKHQSRGGAAELVHLKQNNKVNNHYNLSEFADLKNYRPANGYSALKENAISMKKKSFYQGELYHWEKAKINLDWKDPLERWNEYQLEVASDPQFKNIITSYKGEKKSHLFKVGRTGKYYWRVRGIDTQGGKSSWTDRFDVVVKIIKKSRNHPVRFVQDRFLYKMNRKTLEKLGEDGWYKVDKETPVNVSWEHDVLATKYLMEIADKEDFSMILGKKIIRGNSLSLKRLVVGKTYFRLSPMTEEGFLTAKRSYGYVKAYFPASQSQSLKVLSKKNKKTLTWEEIPSVGAYEISYYESPGAKKKSVKYVSQNKAVLENKTGYLRWKVRAIDPISRKPVGFNSSYMVWNHAVKSTVKPNRWSKRGATSIGEILRKTKEKGGGSAVNSLERRDLKIHNVVPMILKPEQRKTFFSTANSMLFVEVHWDYEKESQIYEVQIFSEDDGIVPVYSEVVEGSKHVIVNQKFRPGIYKIRVRAIEGQDSKHPWSTSKVFRVIKQRR